MILDIAHLLVARAGLLHLQKADHWSGSEEFIPLRVKNMWAFHLSMDYEHTFTHLNTDALSQLTFYGLPLSSILIMMSLDHLRQGPGGHLSQGPKTISVNGPKTISAKVLRPSLSRSRDHLRQRPETISVNVLRPSPSTS
ncbi:hypothetical protein RRG08_044666 [Elysia crispata]|uniref:Uncharacterized protein n=1 Tax=Elysia crispata TaxID=231223 RepID=A0AAE1DBC1_9GAST|nr:hypothetical protein RRG08_044666 [Elysia crispata]